MVSCKEIADGLSSMPDWIPSHAVTRTIEVLSLLGPFFSRTSVFPDVDPVIGQAYFPSADPYGELQLSEGSLIGARNRADVQSAKASLRDIFALVQTQLGKITMSIIKGGPQGKEGVLSYLAHVLKLNKDRGKMQVGRLLVFFGFILILRCH